MYIGYKQFFAMAHIRRIFVLSKYFYMAYTFIISDESVNADGFVIQTKGIRTERFKKNPVMLYMHEREKGVIGRWDNIRAEGTQLIADAVFDENNPLGKEVKERVDGGFLRSASIGLSVLNYEKIDGVDTVTDCELTEGSIVDIPSNQNAVKLFNKKGLIVLSLKESTDGNKDLRTQLIEVLKLSATATDGEIIETVTALSGNAGPAEPDTEKALRLGYVDSSQLMLLKHMARTDKSAFRKFMQDKEQAAAVNIDKELKQAVNLGKFGMPDRGVFEHIGKQLGVKALKEVLEVMPEKVSFAAFFGPNRNDMTNRANWGLKEYRKYDPQALSDDPELYARLREKEYGEEQEPYHNLAYYRKHNPEYLAQHPDQYERLLARERKNK